MRFLIPWIITMFIGYFLVVWWQVNPSWWIGSTDFTFLSIIAAVFVLSKGEVLILSLSNGGGCGSGSGWSSCGGGCGGCS